MSKQVIKSTLADKRYWKAVLYLKTNNIDIDSRSDDFYRNAIKIAAGIKVKK